MIARFKMPAALTFALAAAMVAGGCASDDPSIWGSVEKVLEEADNGYAVKEIRSRIDISILTYVVTLDCEPTIPGANKVQVQFDRKWHLDPKSRLGCRQAS